MTKALAFLALLTFAPAQAQDKSDKVAVFVTG